MATDVTEDDYARDLEETNEVLEAALDDPVEFWEAKQRDLVTSVLDYNLGTLSELITAKTIGSRQSTSDGGRDRDGYRT